MSSTTLPQSSIPRRSVLFMPITNERATSKAASLPVDSVILDLEDSVHPDRKAEARGLIADKLSVDYGYREMAIRINGTDTREWKQDLQAIGKTCRDNGNRVDGIVIPKVTDVKQIDAVVSELSQFGMATTNLWIMIETPEAILNLPALCSYGNPVGVVLVGTADLAKAMQIPYRKDRLGLQQALSSCVLAARANGLAIVDGVYMNINNQQGLESECQQGVALGFDGKSLIHPAQLACANQLFSPDEQALADARGLVNAHEDAMSRNEGVCVYQNQLVEQLHVEQARQLIAFAEVVALRS